MKKSAFPAALLLIAAGLSGCPIYDHADSGCYRDSDCASGYLCNDDTGDCYPEDGDGTACRKPSDCGTNETCSRSGSCTTGDCHFSSVGCVRGYTCSSASGRWECVDDSPSSSNVGGAASSAAGQAGEASQSGASSGGAGG